MGNENRDEFLERSLDDKVVIRHELRRLPIEDKMKVIALMQRRANEIRRATGRPTTLEWSWNVVGIEPSSPPPLSGSFLASLGLHELAKQELQSRKEQQVAAVYNELENALVQAHPGVMEVVDVYTRAVNAISFADQYLSSYGVCEPTYVNLTGSKPWK